MQTSLIPRHVFRLSHCHRMCQIFKTNLSSIHIYSTSVNASESLALTMTRCYLCCPGPQCTSPQWWPSPAHEEVTFF